MKIGFQGLKGAYSEQALNDYFEKKNTSIGYETFEEVFEALKDNEIEQAIIPIENSIAGSVVENYDLLFSEDVTIIGEYFLPVHHNLLAIPKTKIEEIKKAYSHPQALSQCRKFLLKNNITAISYYDTAGAAEFIKEQQDKTSAAISSALCAEIYGLEIIKQEIAGSKSNTTRFVIIVKTENRPEIKIANKTSLAFKTKHYPGALVDCLKIFHWYDLNLTKLESRPIPENPFEYVFFVAFEAGLDDHLVKKALRKLDEKALFVKILGSYRKGK
jgi:prephenate dehydratase